MVSVRSFSGPGFNSQIISSFVAMQNSLGVQSRSTPKSEAIEEEPSVRMQRVLAEALAEFEFEEEVHLVSQCVERCPKIEETVKEKTVKEENAKE